MKTKPLAFLALALSAVPAFGDQKVSNRVALAAGSVAPATDILPIVDVSAGTAGSKKITINDLFTGWGFTADGKTLVTAANFAAMRTSLGLVPGTNVQAWDADLDDWAGKTAPSGTAVGTSDTQTLSNKSLTSPKINVGSDATGDVYYRDSGGSFSRLAVGSTGQVLTVAGGLPAWSTPAGLAHWTEAVSSASPNGSIPVVSWAPSNAAANVDVAILPKGTGAIVSQVPDSTTTGGDKRGTYSTDLQRRRTSANQVCAGPGSVIAGGENNLTGSSSVYCVVGGGSGNSIASQYGVIGGGSGNSITGSVNNYVVIAGGQNNTASALNASIGGGSNNTTSGELSWIPGGSRATTRGLYGMGASASGRFSTDGDAQRGKYLARRATTDATPTELSLDGNAPASTTRIVLPNNHAYAFRGRLIARSSTGDVAVWNIDGVIKRGANAAATALVGTPTATMTFNDAGASAWVVTLTADTTNGSFKIEVTGAASTTIHWLAELETVEVS